MTNINWPTFVLAVLGALSWTTEIPNWVKKNEIYGKIQSEYANFAVLPNGDSSLVIVQKVALFSENKDFFPKDIKVFLKYPGSSNEIQGKLWTWRDLRFVFIEHGQKVVKKLNINLNDYLINEIIYPRNELVVGYVSFSVNHSMDEMFEYIRYEFTDYRGKEKKLEILKDDIEDNKLIHEDNIWTE